jgi:purine-nucleoside phosphorylase
MSIHIGAAKGDIAPTVLMPGDPLRAKFFAETFLEDAVCFNEVRGMLGFTGMHKGKRVSVMGSGMGMPTLSIYLNELFREYDVTTVMRVGTCGAIREGIDIGDIILPMTSSTNAHFNKLRFEGMDFAPAADFELLRGAYDFAKTRTDRVHVGSIFSSDTFYNDDPDWWKRWSEFGSLACEMETNALYTLASKYGARALSVLTVSDSIVTGAEATSEQRERGFPLMAEIALSVVP